MTEQNTNKNTDKKSSKKMLLGLISVLLILLCLGLIVIGSMRYANHYLEFFETEESCEESNKSLTTPSTEDLEGLQGLEEMLNTQTDKPVIYLYPSEEADINVTLNSDNIAFTSTYPKYTNNGWRVKAHPDGTLIDSKNRQYNYLFWEGIVKDNSFKTLDEGFCVKGEDTLKFLEEKLTRLGLTDKEQCDFISYWLPRMENNAYNIIKFAKDDYVNAVGLETSYEFDTEITVHMVWKASDSYVKLPEQKLETVYRVGSTLVEWGGTELN